MHSRQKKRRLCNAKVGKESQRGRAAGATLVQSATKEAGETEGTTRNNGIIIVECLLSVAMETP